METGTGGAWNVHSYDELLSVRALPVYRPTTDYHRLLFFFGPVERVGYNWPGCCQIAVAAAAHGSLWWLHPKRRRRV